MDSYIIKDENIYSEMVRGTVFKTGSRYSNLMFIGEGAYGTVR